MAGDREDKQLNLPTGGGGGGPSGEAPFHQESQSPHDAVGAYVLDALSDAERDDFSAHLATCASCQREAAELAEIVGLLPGIVELEHRSGSVSIPEPSAKLRERVLQAVRSESSSAPASQAESPPIVAVPPTRDTDDQPVPFPLQRSDVRTGRFSEGSGPTPFETIGRMRRSWLIAAVLAVMLAGAGIWSIVLLGDADDKDQEIARLQDELDVARQRANASAWHLGSSNGGEEHSGTLLYGLQDQTVVLVVRNMPELPSDQVYQTWLIRGSTAPEPGTTFSVGSDGTGLTLVDPNAPTYDVVAITTEPSGGSDSPTTAPLLVGQLSGAVGMVPGFNMASVQLAPPDDAS